MKTLNEIQKKYGARLNKRRVMQQWINSPVCQAYIQKALNNKLTDSDIDNIFEIGNWRSTYPGLYYLCTIYIHPLTYLQGIVQKIT